MLRVVSLHGLWREAQHRFAHYVVRKAAIGIPLTGTSFAISAAAAAPLADSTIAAATAARGRRRAPHDPVAEISRLGAHTPSQSAAAANRFAPSARFGARSSNPSQPRGDLTAHIAVNSPRRSLVVAQKSTRLRDLSTTLAGGAQSHDPARSVRSLDERGSHSLASLDIANPLVAWLVYRGEIVSSAEAHEQALGFWLMHALGAESSTGHRSTLFQHELILDGFRQVHQAHAISRLRGFYLFDDATSAERAIQQGGGSFHRDALTEVGIL